MDISIDGTDCNVFQYIVNHGNSWISEEIILTSSYLLVSSYLTSQENVREVIKIEDTGNGDPSRHIGPQSGGLTVYYRNANRGKKSLSLDLKSAEGRELFLRLAETADVILETFRPGVVDRLGIGYDVVAPRAPQVVYCSISAFGQDGPYRDRPAHDISVCALAGVASLSLDKDGQPNMPCMPPSDMGGSLMAFAGILMALVGRARTGKGDYLDMSM